jgi:hypothetical protein
LCSIGNTLERWIQASFYSSVPKATDHTRRLRRLGRLCSSADDMHDETARLIRELSSAPRQARSAAIALKRRPVRRRC